MRLSRVHLAALGGSAPPEGETGSLGDQPLLRLLGPPAIKAADLTAFDPPGSTCSYYGVTLWHLDFGGGIYLQNALGASLELPAYVLMKVTTPLVSLATPL